MTDQFVDGDRQLAPLLLLHGTGGTERDLIPIGHFLAPDSPLLSIGAPLIENGMSRYFKHTPSGGFDYQSLNQQTDWLLDRVAALSNQYQLDASRLIVAGYSNGANVALRAMLERPVPFRAGLFFHAMSLGQEVPNQDLSDSNVWLSHGTHDPIVPADNFARLTGLLRRQHANIEVFQHQESHNLNQAELQSAQAWLQQSGRLS